MSNPISQLIEDMPNYPQRRSEKTNYINFKPDAEEKRFELYLLDEGQKKVETEEETRELPRSPQVGSIDADARIRPQVSPTPPNSPSIRKTTRLATYSRSAFTSTRMSSSQHTKFRIRCSRPLSSASPPMAALHRSRL